MMQLTDTQWSIAEEKIAQTALSKAKEREINALVTTVRQQASGIQEFNDLWYLHDFLSARRYDLDGKYDSRNATVIFALAGLVKEGWLKLGELEGLDKEKITKVSAMTRMI
ncbi:hypothetical protein [Okeania sp. KiyG1]|uniref:hypothetical protein n=1 Tax=Okeania sp. KiyG1 TaxID=2720165 RepID=UPI001924C4B1|nr:hypothetical protein [Okeania sp. KiyG1]GGA25275.1 hypothetical protein CYANOKiyG1_41010 [Okeania sp. KiyG1]